MRKKARLNTPASPSSLHIATCSDADGDTYAIEGGDCGPIDCNDLDMFINPCAIENCTDAVDNDCDDLTDCADQKCASAPACVPCTDGDGKVDCADKRDCKKDPACS